MLIEICLIVIAAALSALVAALIIFFNKTQQSVQILQADLHRVSTELSCLLDGLDQFVRSDLHTFSQETRLLVGNLNDLSSDFKEKSQSLDVLFKPFSFLKSKLSSDSTEEESAPKLETIRQAAKWIGSTFFLLKTTKEFIKNHENRT